MSSNNLEKTKVKKIFILFCTIFFFITLLIVSLYDTISKTRRLPSLQSTKVEYAIRGDVVSKDNFKISSSKKLFKATIDTRCLNKEKEELFINLFSTYSGIDPQVIKQKLLTQDRPGALVLSYDIDSRTAINLKELSFKLKQLDVFDKIKINGNDILIGLDVGESGEKRIFSYKDVLTPAIGYVTKKENKNAQTKVLGVKGLENKYNEILNNSKDGILKGERDVLSYISFNKNSVIINREDGNTLALNIPLKLQRNVELILDRHKEKLSAEEVIASIIDTQTGKVITLASSNRFDPGNIKQSDIPNLNVHAIEMAYEPGSILKPISMALVLEKNRLRENELFNAFNKGGTNDKGEFPRGKYPIGKYVIGDDHQFKKNAITIDDIIVYSSNIGILQVAQRLSGREFFDGLVKFGMTQKTGIDLPYEQTGIMPSVAQFSAGESRGVDNIYKATVSFGQGMTATFMQMLRAYTVFNNDGYIITPYLVSEVLNDKGEVIARNTNANKEQIVSSKVANRVKSMLIKTVKEGTGEITDIPGLEIGGKTATAQIARRGTYLKEYISSFFGFVNDKTHKYTIGVTVVKPNAEGVHWYYRYGSQSAAPVFKEMIETLVRLGYLEKFEEQ